jgi:hypothetical protein
MKIRKKSFILVMVISMVSISISICYATSIRSTGLEGIKTDEVVKAIERYSTDNYGVEDLECLRNSYNVDLEDLSVEIPKNDSELIVELSKMDKNIEITMPDEAENMRTKLKQNDTVYYSGKNQDVSFAVQAISESTKEEFNGIREAIVIENADAPKSYSFTFNAGEGSQILHAEDIKNFSSDSDDSLYLVDNNGNIIMEIASPWAVDAKGKHVDTHYIVEGNTLTQIVDFDENTLFPIVADPTAKVAKVGTSYSSYSYPKKSGYPSGQPIKGYRCDGYINVNTGKGTSKSLSVSYNIPVLGISVGGSVSCPIGKSNGVSASASGVSCKIPNSHYYYKAKVTTTLRCRAWAHWRQLSRGKQVTDKGITKEIYQIQCSAVKCK